MCWRRPHTYGRRSFVLQRDGRADYGFVLQRDGRADYVIELVVQELLKEGYDLAVHTVGGEGLRHRIGRAGIVEGGSWRCRGGGARADYGRQELVKEESSGIGEGGRRVGRQELVKEGVWRSTRWDRGCCWRC